MLRKSPLVKTNKVPVRIELEHEIGYRVEESRIAGLALFEGRFTLFSFYDPADPFGDYLYEAPLLFEERSLILLRPFLDVTDLKKARLGTPDEDGLRLLP